MKLCIAFLCFFCSLVAEGFGANGCTLNVAAHDDKYMPIILHNRTSTHEFIIPKNGKIQIRHGEKISLACPTPRNSLVISNANLTSATCVEGQTLEIIGKNKKFSHILCKSIVRGVALSTNDKCGNQTGQLIKIGYQVNRKEFLNLIEVCYDMNRGGTLFAQHLLYGSEIKYKSKSSYRPQFSVEQIPPGVPAAIAYKQTSQKSLFEQLVGSSKLASSYINKKSYLARGHLAPDADFLYAPWQYTTYYYVNTVPQWQSINNGNWKKLENLVRKTSEIYGKTFDVYTGSHEVLSLLNTDDKLVDIYLVRNKKLPVPKFVWKIVYSEESQSAIALINVNNPFIKRLNDRDILCEDICEQSGWGQSTWKNFQKGYVYCCDARDLLKVIKTGPKINVRKILQGPN